MSIGQQGVVGPSSIANVKRSGNLLAFKRLSECHEIDHQSFFLVVVPSFARQSYSSDFESVQRTRPGNIGAQDSVFDCPLDCRCSVVSNPCAMAYSSDVSTLRVTRRHFVDDQCSIELSARMVIY